MKRNLKKATGSENSFVCINCDKQYSRQKPYQMYVSVYCKERKVRVKKGRSVYSLFIIVGDTYGFILGLAEVTRYPPAIEAISHVLTVAS